MTSGMSISSIQFLPPALKGSGETMAIDLGIINSAAMLVQRGLHPFGLVEN